MEELVGRPSHLSPPLIGYLAAPQLSIHLSAVRFPTRRAVAVVGLLLHCTIPSCDDGTGTHTHTHTYINAQNAPIVNGFVSRQHRKPSLRREMI